MYKKIKTLHLDFTPRAAINADGAHTLLATMVRVYQLKDSKEVDAADYHTLLRKADTVLKNDAQYAHGRGSLMGNSLTTLMR